MPVDILNYNSILSTLQQHQVTLVAVSKTKPKEDIEALYALGQRDFGENYVQELMDKQAVLPSDIRWHFIGHLQTNKVKYIAPFVYLIHGIDSLKLLVEVNKQGQKLNKVIQVLLQVHIAQEETKFGLDEAELKEIMTKAPELKYVSIQGFMGMASFTEDVEKVRAEFKHLKGMATPFGLPILSMGMSGDYKLAMEEGSTMVRIGSLLFGSRKRTL